MRKFIDLILHFKPASWPLFLVSSLLILVTFALLYYKQNLPPLMPLWYSQPWGPGRLTATSNLLVVPVFALCFLVINHYLANLFKSNNLALSKILIWSAFLTALISLIAIHKILLLA